MSAEEPGFVFILTTQSVREDWIKIGKSSHPIEKRNTSGAYQGAILFTFRGEVLHSIRSRIES